MVRDASRYGQPYTGGPGAGSFGSKANKLLSTVVGALGGSTGPQGTPSSSQPQYPQYPQYPPQYPPQFVPGGGYGQYGTSPYGPPPGYPSYPPPHAGGQAPWQMPAAYGPGINTAYGAPQVGSVSGHVSPDAVRRLRDLQATLARYEQLIAKAESGLKPAKIVEGLDTASPSKLVSIASYMTNRWENGRLKDVDGYRPTVMRALESCRDLLGGATLAGGSTGRINDGWDTFLDLTGLTSKYDVTSMMTLAKQGEIGGTLRWLRANVNQLQQLVDGALRANGG